MRITKRALYLQSCKQSVIIGKWKCKHCFSRAHFRTAGRPSAHTDGKNNLKRNSLRQNDQRDSGREASEFSNHQQSPKKYIPQTGSEQCARGYQICHAGRHCGSGGILYLKQKSVPKINPNTPIHTDLEQRPIIKPHLCTNRCHLKELSLYSYPISPLPKQTRDSAS